MVTIPHAPCAAPRYRFPRHACTRRGARVFVESFSFSSFPSSRFAFASPSSTTCSTTRLNSDIGKSWSFFFPPSALRLANRSACRYPQRPYSNSQSSLGAAKTRSSNAARRRAPFSAFSSSPNAKWIAAATACAPDSPSRKLSVSCLWRPAGPTRPAWSAAEAVLQKDSARTSKSRLLPKNRRRGTRVLFFLSIPSSSSSSFVIIASLYRSSAAPHVPAYTEPFARSLPSSASARHSASHADNRRRADDDAVSANPARSGCRQSSSRSCGKKRALACSLKSWMPPRAPDMPRARGRATRNDEQASRRPGRPPLASSLLSHRRSSPSLSPHRGFSPLLGRGVSLPHRRSTVEKRAATRARVHLRNPKNHTEYFGSFRLQQSRMNM